MAGTPYWGHPRADGTGRSPAWEAIEWKNARVRDAARLDAPQIPLVRSSLLPDGLARRLRAGDAPDARDFVLALPEGYQERAACRFAGAGSRDLNPHFQLIA